MHHLKMVQVHRFESQVNLDWLWVQVKFQEQDGHCGGDDDGGDGDDVGEEAEEEEQEKVTVQAHRYHHHEDTVA